MKIIYTFILLVMIVGHVRTQPFVESSSNLVNVFLSSMDYSDVDGDNDLDLFIIGSLESSPLLVPTAKLYINNGSGGYNEQLGGDFTSVIHGSVVFEDIDNDGDEDLIVTGMVEPFLNSINLYENDGMGNFTKILNTPFQAVFESSIAFADVDGDNDLDLFINGKDADINIISKMYINDGDGVFEESTNNTFPQLEYPAIAFADIDGDDDQDLVMSGQANVPNGDSETRVFENDGMGNYLEVNNYPFADLSGAELVFFDSDGDNDLDLIVSGFVSNAERVVKIYVNEGTGGFTEKLNLPFEGVSEGSISVADVDGDKDEDILITGINSSFNELTQYYINDGFGNYSELIDVPFLNLGLGFSALIDVDEDGDKDVIISGRKGQDSPKTLLYINQEIVSSLKDVSISSESKFSIFPNPTNQDVVTVNFFTLQSKFVVLNLYNTSGICLGEYKVFMKHGYNDFTVDTSFLPSGQFVMKISDGIMISSKIFFVK